MQSWVDGKIVAWTDCFTRVRGALARAKTTYSDVLLSSRTSIWTWHKFALHHFPSKLSTECFCGKILGVMKVFLRCIIKALHGALMTVPEPEPTSLHEEGFAVWMWECVITLYVQCNEREADREAWLRRLPSTLAKAVKLKSFYTFCWVIIISWQTHTFALKNILHLFFFIPFTAHSSLEASE